MADQLPLEGIRVLELSEGWTSPLSGKLLVDLGADVLRLTDDDADQISGLGDEAPYARRMLDAGKSVLRLSDIADDGLAALIARADVVIGDHRLLAKRDVEEQAGPHTVICVISPFGSDGPLADDVASDLTLQALTAIMATTGEPGGAPLRAGTELGAAVAAIYGCIGVVAGLLERLRSARGQVVEVSVYDCLFSTLTQFVSRVLGGVPPLRRMGNQGANSAPWNLFQSGDGQYVFIIAGSDPTFERLSAVMERAELLADPRFDNHIHRRENREEITSIVQEWASKQTADGIVTSLRDAGVPVSLVATPAQVLADPHFISRHLLGSVEVDGRRWPVPGTPLAIGHTWADGDAVTPLTAEAWLAGEAFVAGPDGERAKPLAGFTVLDIGTITAGPFCARLLGNLGADVIKVEPVGGELGRHSPPIVEGESVYFHITNNGKQSVCLDLGTPEGQSHLTALAATADVLVENLAPGGLVKRGLGPADLTAANPRLIYTSVSGFGHEGAAGGQRAYDTVVQAAAGMMTITGEVGGTPLKTGISSADVLGALGGTAATLAALYRRERTGDDTGGGGWLDVAMYDVLAWSMQMRWPRVFLGDPEVERAGNAHQRFAPHGSYDAADGLLVLSCETDAQWAALLGVLAAHEVDDVPGDWSTYDTAARLERRDEIDDLLRAWTSELERNTVVAECQAAGVSAAPVLECAEVAGSAQTEVRNLITAVGRAGHPTIKVTNFPIKLLGTPVGVTGPAPDVDEQGDEIRARY